MGVNESGTRFTGDNAVLLRVIKQNADHIEMQNKKLLEMARISKERVLEKNIRGAVSAVGGFVAGIGVATSVTQILRDTWDQVLDRVKKTQQAQVQTAPGSAALIAQAGSEGQLSHWQGQAIGLRNRGLFGSPEESMKFIAELNAAGRNTKMFRENMAGLRDVIPDRNAAIQAIDEFGDVFGGESAKLLSKYVASNELSAGKADQIFKAGASLAPIAKETGLSANQVLAMVTAGGQRAGGPEKAAADFQAFIKRASGSKALAGMDVFQMIERVAGTDIHNPRAIEQLRLGRGGAGLITVARNLQENMGLYKTALEKMESAEATDYPARKIEMAARDQYTMAARGGSATGAVREFEASREATAKTRLDFIRQQEDMRTVENLGRFLGGITNVVKSYYDPLEDAMTGETAALGKAVRSAGERPEISTRFPFERSGIEEVTAALNNLAAKLDENNKKTEENTNATKGKPTRATEPVVRTGAMR